MHVVFFATKGKAVYVHWIYTIFFVNIPWILKDENIKETGRRYLVKFCYNLPKPHRMKVQAHISIDN